MDNSENDLGHGVGSGERTGVYTSESSDSGNDVKSATREVMGEARRRSQEVADKAVHEAGQVASRFRDQAGSAISAGKTQLADQIGGVARALKASSSQLRGDELGGLADLSDTLAGQVEAAQHYLRERSGEVLLGDLQTFARRRRGLFVGSLLFAGLLTAHFAGRGTPNRAAGGAEARRSSSATPPSATVVTRGEVKTYPRGPS